MVKVNIEITNSKIIAYLLLFSSVALDFANDKNGTIFMFSVPFIVALISGKQFFDKTK
jgi:hypothetical protein